MKKLLAGLTTGLMIMLAMASAPWAADVSVGENFKVINGGVEFEDGSVQFTAVQQGIPGPEGPQGPAGPAGPVGELPTGIITMWSGAIGSIPAGWALCDGTNGTPNLRDRFVMGAGGGYAVGLTGGEAAHVLTVAEMPTHTHGVTDPGHRHGYRNGGGTTSSGYAANSNDGTHPTQYTDNATTGITVNNAGGGNAHNNLPPYYALAFIMKL